MRRFILIFAFLGSLLLLFSFIEVKNIAAFNGQGVCGCVRSGYLYNMDDKTFDRWCKPDPSRPCSDTNTTCQCTTDTCNSSDPSCTSNKPCSNGACGVVSRRCEDLPSAYCISECRLPVPERTCDSGLVCCSITVADRDPNCVNDCNTQCVFGNNLPGFTCKVEAGARQTQTCACYPPAQAPGAVDPYSICQGNLECEACIDTGKSYTAFGCLPTNNPQEFIAWLLQAAIGMAGGIAVILMIFGGFLIILSSGDPQRLQTGKDILTSAIIGLVIIIFSVFLLRIIGVEILKIPGFE